MQFKLTLKIDRKNGDKLPFNYQYEQSAVIYRILAKADSCYSAWLHENGYVLNGTKRFKLFAYSPFAFDRVKALPQEGCLHIIGDRAIWHISFIPEKSTMEFIQGIFANQQFTIGNKMYNVTFDVVGVEAIPEPSLSEEMSFQALSPICVKLHENGKIKYLSPQDALFPEGILKGLLEKYESIEGKPFSEKKIEYKFVILGDRIKSKLITIKAGTPSETKVRGFLFSFRMKVPIELMKIAYEGGIGEQCSQGFGFIQKIE